VLTRIDHVGIACHDLERSVAHYQEVFGLAVVSRETNDEQGVREALLVVADPGDGAAAALGGGSYLQLLEPLGPETPVGRFLARRGEGIHHIGYGVADVRAAMAAVAGRGVRLLDARPRHGSMGASIAFVHPKDVGGVLTEFVEAAPR
jgi:methylmalonyl-CoA/ethylmalonyl-CoA epimerase